MKRLYTLLLASMTYLMASAQFTVTMQNGKTSDLNGSPAFARMGTNDQWSIGDKYNYKYDISTIGSISLKPLAQRLEEYEAPAYNDYYVGVTAWNYRSKWNLANVHDPSVMKADDGYYYMYTTDASYGNAHAKHGSFHCRRSRNLVDWEYLGATMPTPPAWIETKLNEIRAAMGLGASTADLSATGLGFWAPCARKVSSGLYRMYYAIVVPGTINGDGTWSERAFIGLMETDNPADVSSWQDKGYVITNVSDKGLNYNVANTNYANCYFKYNAIDPSYIITPEGEHWLIYGSWHSGFAAVQLNPDTGMPLEELGNPWGEGIEKYGKLVNTRKKNNRWQGSEAPEVVYHDGYYYLFMAYDELSVAYNTRVVRSKNIDGPYYGMDGTNVSVNGGDAYPIITHPYKFDNSYGWVGISHCAVFDDGQGNWYYSSQGRYPQYAYGNDFSNALMMGQVRSLVWTESGWPVVMPERYGAVPQTPISEDELIGKWENIIMAYHYQKECGPQTMVLGADHKVTSGWSKGKTWSFDAYKNILTIGTYKMYLKRETDWESATTKHTIVYAGHDAYTSSTTKRSFWGKKVADDDVMQTVGNTDFTSAWNEACSDAYTIAAGKTLHLNFTNHSSKANNFNNWVLVVSNNANRDADNYIEHFVIRADNYGWFPNLGGNTNDNTANVSFTLESDYNWSTFKTDMDGAMVNIHVTRDASNRVVVIAQTTSASTGTVYTQRFIVNNIGSGAIRAFLVTDASWYEINKTTTKVE